VGRPHQLECRGAPYLARLRRPEHRGRQDARGYPRRHRADLLVGGDAAPHERADRHEVQGRDRIPGPTSAQLAFERGEVDGIVKPWSSIKTSTPEWLREKKINLIVQHTRVRHPELPDVPTIVDLGQDAEQRQIFGLFAGGAALGTALVAPPGLPEGTVAALRKAFDQTMRDPALLDEVRKSNIDIDPLSGADLQSVIDSTFVIAPDVLERARRLSPQ
jgi:hypothetical protein